MRPGSPSFLNLTKVGLWVLGLMPLAGMLLGLFEWQQFSLGANPIETLLHRCGEWGLNILLLSLAITPLRHWLGWPWLVRYRRLVGLFAFFYLSLHLSIYTLLDQRLDPAAILEDVAKRPYITLGLLAWLILLPMAATSTRGMMRRLGRRWKILHRGVYAVAVLGVWHYWWQVKAGVIEPLVYALILSILLFSRWWRHRRRTSA
jgi:sulfoxide reductase heme-binding subunit YedZ